jgi:hypothetical protein
MKLKIKVAPIAAGFMALAAAHLAHAQLAFTPGDLVVSVEGNGSNTGTYTDNQAAPLTLDQFAINGTSSATAAGSMMLPQNTVGNQSAISGEYGSSSEGALQLSGNGQFLTIMGYGINANTFNSAPLSTYGSAALAQSTNVSSSTFTNVSRVVALIGANGSVDTSTALTGVFSGNNPRSVYTVDGSSFYVSGQGTSGDSTGGVFYATLGATTATSITGIDAGSGSAQDTRSVMVYNNTLYVSSDSKSGATNRDYIGTLGSAGTLPTTVANSSGGPAMLPGFGNSGGTGKVSISSGSNGDGNGLNAGLAINLSPENYFFANATTLYVADSGDPKNTSNCTGTCTGITVGDGGLQKWSLVGGSWQLDYTLASGLHLVSNGNGTATTGTSGLLGLTGEVVGNTVELFATNYTLGDTDQTYLYGISDSLSATTAGAVTGETFTTLETAAPDTNFKGVAFAPVPLPATAWLLLSGLAGLLRLTLRSRPSARTTCA